VTARGDTVLLAGDVGGTKVNLALYRAHGGALAREAFESYRSAEHDSLESIVRAFLAARPRVDRACIGVAGPVDGGRSRLTNLSWTVDAEGLAEASGASAVALLNDLQATACAVPVTPPEGFAVLQAGDADPEGTVAVLAAGTGHGQAYLFPSGGRFVPGATEGGHVDFAPRDAREARLLAFLQARHAGRVSIERVVSGPGLKSIHEFLAEDTGLTESPDIAERMREKDPSAVIAECGLSGRSALCHAALAMFVSLYGAAAGNLALVLLPRGGVVLGGGIAPAILPALQEGPFLESFRDKGRFRTFLKGLRVSVLLDPSAPLLGAAHYALSLR
jgi:glucokinase